jgi:hypothetical protein
MVVAYQNLLEAVQRTARKLMNYNINITITKRVGRHGVLVSICEAMGLNTDYLTENLRCFPQMLV